MEGEASGLEIPGRRIVDERGRHHRLPQTLCLQHSFLQSKLSLALAMAEAGKTNFFPATSQFDVESLMASGNGGK